MDKMKLSYVFMVLIILSLKSQESSDQLFKQASDAYYQWDFDQALTLYQKSLALDWHNAQAHFNIGFILATYKNNLDEGINHYLAALMINPQYAKARFFLGRVFDQKGELDKAITSYKHALKDTDATELKNLIEEGLAQTLYKKHAFTSAQQAIEAIEAITSNNTHAMYQLAQLFEKDNHLSEAISLYTTVMRQNPEHHAAQEKLAHAYRTHLGIEESAQQSYQDISINNITVCTGNQACQERYAALKQFLSNYKRPITFLDITPHQGYFSFKIAHDFPSTCVMISPDPSLVTLCSLNSMLDNIIVLQTKPTLEEFNRLGECEHFDVVLASNAIAWFEPGWQESLHALLALGDYIIIETPFIERSQLGNHFGTLLDSYLTAKGGSLLNQTIKSGYTASMYLFAQHKESLQRTHWTRDHTTAEYKIESTFERKVLKKFPAWKEYPWVQGINLLTFKMLNGTWPTLQSIEDTLSSLYTIKSSDISICNMVIQGNKILPIDCNDPRGQTMISNPEEPIKKIMQHLALGPTELYNLIS